MDTGLYAIFLSPEGRLSLPGVYPTPDEARDAYSVRILSAHSTSATSFGGSENAAFLPARSSARTPRAREQAPQTWIGTRCAITFASASESGAQPTGTTAFATTVRIRDTASPSRKTWTWWPASAN